MMEGCVSWPDGLAEEYKAKGYWENTTLGEHFDSWVEKYPERIAVACGGGNRLHRGHCFGSHATPP